MAPSAATVLSDYGAEVVKIEPPGVGDQNRYLHQLTGLPVSDIPYAFFQVNRNKRSVALDLKNDAARGALTKLIERADIFITNYREPALKKLKLTWDDVQAVNPRTIYAWATGHGEK
ncbi:MAG: CoA transferase, partial [Candidatus Hydrogenedentota bacterium]